MILCEIPERHAVVTLFQTTFRNIYLLGFYLIENYVSLTVTATLTVRQLSRSRVVSQRSPQVTDHSDQKVNKSIVAIPTMCNSNGTVKPRVRLLTTIGVRKKV